MNTDTIQPVATPEEYQQMLQRIRENRQAMLIEQEKQLYQGLSQTEIEFYKQVTDYTEKCSHPASGGEKLITQQISPVYFPYIYQGLPALKAKYAHSFGFVQQAIQANQDYILNYARQHNMDIGQDQDAMPSENAQSGSSGCILA